MTAPARTPPLASRDVYGLFVHGVGEQSSDFAQVAKQSLANALAKQGRKLFASSVHWAPLADTTEHAFLKNAEARGSAGNPMQKLVVGTLADALYYQSNQRLREQIAYLIDWEYSTLRAGSVHIFAHSLGGLIVTDWLRARKNVRPAKLHTFGCNLGLFNLGKTFDCPVSVQNDGSWVNYYAPRDMLGFALRVQAGFQHVRDVKVKVGSWLTRWNGLAHCGYFTDKDFWSKTVSQFV